MVNQRVVPRMGATTKGGWLVSIPTVPVRLIAINYSRCVEYKAYLATKVMNAARAFALRELVN